MPKVPTEIPTPLSPPPRVHSTPFAADARKLRTLSARIFAELLPRSTLRMATVRPALRPLRPRPSWGGSAGRPSGGVSPPLATPTQSLRMAAPRAGKEPLLMKVYRTESRYYFSSRQLLPSGSLVFFSDKLRRYVHPTDGTLLDPHPRLQLLSEAESQEFVAHWQEALARL
jgi:hypothetical protein